MFTTCYEQEAVTPMTIRRSNAYNRVVRSAAGVAVAGAALAAFAAPAAHADTLRSVTPAQAAAAPAAPAAFRLQPAPSFKTGKDALAGTALTALGVWRSFLSSGSLDDLGRFIDLRDRLATKSAQRLGVSARAMRAAWRSTDTTHQVALLAALTQLGTAYRGYKRIPGVGFDCSGLTSWSWQQAGVTIERQSGYQIRASEHVTQSAAKAGDLVYYPGHVMMYLGVAEAIVHAPYTGRSIELAFVPGKHSVRFGDPVGQTS
jgi:cell wall-associated NlpC family hydrolase